jgi:NAD(P)-dependent dehydrogenase (short-subunit alcohol dehydrogenase family)
MALTLNGITALVTGTNRDRGIGRALVQEWLERGARRVYAAARRTDTLAALAASSGGRVVPVQLDVRQPGEIARAAAAAGDVQLLINNAGVVSRLGGELTDTGWLDAGREEFEVNVLGTLAVTQAFAPVLARNDGGAVVNIVSVAGLVNFPMLASYSASKAALHSITQATRAMLRAQGTFVAGVYPGPIDTDMGDRIEMTKTAPAVVARNILDGLIAGREEIFPDPLAEQVAAQYLANPKALEQQMTQAA